VSALEFDEFQQTRYFPALDGVRAVSVVLVIAWHMPEKDTWRWLNGYAGVQAFFVLSGFLITTLCIREMSGDRNGRLSLRRFYRRRAHRILPLYVLTLAAYTVATAIDFIPSWDAFVDRLPYYLTLNGDLIPGGHPFQHSWTLGVEEKFYALWPLALVALDAAPSKVRIAAATAGLAVLGTLSAGFDYPTNYLGITFGCLLAFCLADREAFELIERWTRSRILVATTFLVTLGLHLLLRQVDGLTLPYSIAVGASIGCILLRPNGQANALLSMPQARWIGRRSYAIYLVHPILIHMVDRVIEPTEELPVALLRLAAAIAAAFIVAALMHRTIEAPLIARGRSHDLSSV
jgi:peptidoglycan/LPS O-acetylase OafA/YrhL